MLQLAKAIVFREQDVATREHDILRRRQELDVKERELLSRKDELYQLRLDFSAVASGRSDSVQSESLALAETRHPPLARANATVARRVLSVLEMEPRALSPAEVHSLLELPPPIDTVRATLWKMAQAGLIARLFHGQYCALQHELLLRTAAARGGG